MRPARLARSMCAATAVVAGMVLAIPATARAGAGALAVEIHGYQFHPDPVTVEVGQPVTWTNEDSAAHDVTSSSGPEAFASPSLATGQSFTHTFAQPGAYTYLCSVHPDMVGSLTVTPAPAAAPVSPSPTVAAGVAPPARAASSGATGSTTAAAAAASVPAPVPVPVAASPSPAVASPGVAPTAAVVRPDLAHALRPYAALLAMAAAVVAGCLLLMGVGRRADAVDG